jgi:hypothetical protein
LPPFGVIERPVWAAVVDALRSAGMLMVCLAPTDQILRNFLAGDSLNFDAAVFSGRGGPGWWHQGCGTFAAASEWEVRCDPSAPAG